MARLTTPHSRPLPTLRAYEASIPPLLRPLIRAYLFGYASSTVPRILTLFLSHLSRRRKNIDVLPEDCFVPSFARILKGGLEWQRFPTFCCALVGGILVSSPSGRVIDRPPASSTTASALIVQLGTNDVFSRFHLEDSSPAYSEILTKWLSTFIAAWFSLQLLQSKEQDAYIDRIPSDDDEGVTTETVRFAGRTMDLTLFALTRAVDVVVGELWSQRRRKRIAERKWTKIETSISGLTDSAIFASSCALIMWSWIYMPSRLPRAYNKWITAAAQVDQRLLVALRRCRYGEIKYGLETGQAPLLQSMCKDYNWPLDYGDPIKSVPFPCEIVHMGTGPNCEYHALSRWVRSFRWAFLTYLPINLALTLRKPSRKAFLRALMSSLRSSSFLGSFIALYYYGICLTRSRLGPMILGTSTPACQRIDSGLCVAGGCSLCGWSILLENASRRKDIALFVTPRALATLLPRRYSWDLQWRETLVFAASTAVVFTCVAEKPERVRGVLGKVLARTLIA
ncbi:hypothetical protein BP5796_06384 [Coleophoma crateriformis]|uniref:Integral membrane protein n=1 Tax=Coleophoma crateriformis TaxID=565419 RepID=A0A3D8RNE0_9HELO|nr:hypothetical protein BP5796_06384 [Coleophoma crateriformis]